MTKDRLTEGWCSAYRAGQICDNGFPTNAACIGATCHGCGRTTEKIPMCMMDDGVPERFLDDAGLPKLATHRRAALQSTESGEP